MLKQQTTINARGSLIDLSEPQVMGILNVTPDSFYDGDRYATVETAVLQARRLLDEGAAILDIGGMSSRPGAEIISASEEIDRVGDVIVAILQEAPDAILSIDTIHAHTARTAIEMGVSIINDISGGRYDEEIVEVAASSGAPFICMHMQGMPHSMQVSPTYGDVVHEVLQYFVERVGVLRAAGVTDIIIDPGFGFGKTVDHNFELLHKLGVFGILELPVLVGLSRKSMVCRVLGVPPEEALNGSTALHMLAIERNAGILRVHDVKEAVEVIRLSQKLRSIAVLGENPDISS